MNILGQTIDEGLDYGSNIPEPSKYKDISWTDSLKYSAQENSLVGLGTYLYDDGIDYAQSSTYNEDVGNKIIKDEFPDIRPEYLKNIVEEARSEDELRYKASDAQKRSLSRDYLESMGFMTTLGTDILGSTADIPLIAGASLVNPFVGGALMANKARAFVTGGVLSYAFDTLQDTYGAREISALEKALGVAFSGTINTFFVKNQGKKVAGDIQSEYYKTQMKSEMGITKEVEEQFNKATSDEERRKILIGGFEKVRQKRAEGKDRSIKQILEDHIDEEYKAGNISKGNFNKLRTDMEYLTKNSKSPTFRHFASEYAIDNTLQNNNLNKTTIEGVKDAYESIGLNITSRNLTPLARQFSKYKTKTVGDKLTPKFLDNSGVEISELLGKMQAIRNNKLGSDEYVKDMAKTFYMQKGVKEDIAVGMANESLASIKKISKEFGDLNIRFKDEEFNPDLAGDNYYPNVYTFNGTDKLMDNGFTKAEIDDYFFGALKSYEKRGVKEGEFKIVSAEKDKALRKIASELASFLGTRKGVSAGLDVDTSRLFKLALESAKLTKKERIELDELLNQTAKGGSSYMKRRMPLDRQYIHRTDDGREISIVDFVSHDIDEVFTKYTREQSGKIAGQKYLVRETVKDADGNDVAKEFNLGTWEGVELLRAKMIKELDDFREASKKKVREIEKQFKDGKISKKEKDSLLKENTITDKQYKDEILRYDYMTYHMHGKPTAGLGLRKGSHGLETITNGSGNANKVQQAINSLNMFRLLGSTPFTMVSELTNTVYYSGVGSLINSLKIMPDMFRFYSGGKFKNEALQEANDIIGLSSDFMHTLRPSMYDGDFSTSLYRTQKDAVDRAVNTGLNVSDKLAQFTLHVGGMIPMQTLMQMSMYTGYIKLLRNVAKGNVSSWGRQMLKEAGLDEEMAKKIGKLIEDNKGKSNTIGFNDWGDSEAQELFTITVKRLMDNVIQKPTLSGNIGLTASDKMIGTSMVGRFFMELKKYMYQSYVKQLGKAVESKSIHHKLMIMAQAGVLTATFIPETYLKSGGDKEYIEEKLKPENVLHEVVSRMTVMGLPTALLGAGSRATLGENVFSPYAGYDRRPFNAIANSLPSVDLVNTLGMLVPDTIDTMFGDERESNNLLKDVSKLSPNILPVQAGYRLANDILED